MIENGFTVAFAPLLPWFVLIGLGALVLAALGFTLMRRCARRRLAPCSPRSPCG